MNSYDPVAVRYSKLKKDRRKHQDPGYRGPERRLEKKRELEIKKIMKKLEKELKA